MSLSDESYLEDYVHQCELPPETKVISYFISDRKKFKQWFRQLFMISPKVSHRRLCVKSYRALEHDRAMHLISNYYMIHPFSAFRFYWEIFMIIVFFIKSITTPFISLFHQKNFHKWQPFLILLRIPCIANIIVEFMSGYYESATREIILDPCKSVMHYLRRTFIFDFIGAIPLGSIFYYSGFDHFQIRLTYFFSITNMVSMFAYTEKFREKRQLYLCTFRMIQFLILFFIGTCWIAASIAIATYADNKEQFEIGTKWKFLKDAFEILFNVGSIKFTSIGVTILVEFIALAFGFSMRNLIMVQLILMFKSLHSSRRKYVQLILELDEFCHSKRLPENLKERIMSYYNFVYQQVYYNEQEIWSTLSEKLKDEILETQTKKWFQDEVFQLCPPSVLQSLNKYINTEIYLKGDIICKAGTLIEYIFFLKLGTVGIFTPDGKEILHIDEGQSFSDSALISGDMRYYDFDIIAIYPCEIFKIHQNEFHMVLQYFPEIYNEAEEILKRRQENKVIIYNDTIYHY